MDTQDEITARCLDLIARSKSLAPGSISLAQTFDELNIDSLDKINLSFEVEEAFHIAIPDESLNTLKTVGDMVQGVKALVAQTAETPPFHSTPETSVS